MGTIDSKHSNNHWCFTWNILHLITEYCQWITANSTALNTWNPKRRSVDCYESEETEEAKRRNRRSDKRIDFEENRVAYCGVDSSTPWESSKVSKCGNRFENEGYLWVSVNGFLVWTFWLKFLVDWGGFEPPTPWLRTKYSYPWTTSPGQTKDTDEW